MTHRRAKVLLAVGALSYLAAGHAALAGPGDREARRTPVVRAVERTAPAVVNISAVEIYQERSPFALFNDPRFEDYFNRYFESAPKRRESRRALGSGVIFRKDGYILTNHHVVSRAMKFIVGTMDGKEYEAGIVGSDPQFDLAVLRIEGAAELTEAPLGDSDELMVGETVIAMGNPFGLSHTITTGVISATKRSIRAGNTVYSDFIQTDASINPGNSGGPLVNIVGEVVGINTAIYQGGEGIGFAIPVNTAKKVVRELLQYGRVHQGWFGLFLQDLTPELRQAFKYPRGGGVLVSNVFQGKEEGGVAVGDIITAMDGREVRDLSVFADLTTGFLPGDEVRLSVFRNGGKGVARISFRQLGPEEGLRLVWDLLGLSLERGSGKKKGMAVKKVREDSFAEQLGLAPGDFLLEIRDVPLDDDVNFVRAVSGIIYRERVPVTLQRGRYVYYLTLRANI